jgi:hypothetical protein
MKRIFVHIIHKEIFDLFQTLILSLHKGNKKLCYNLHWITKAQHNGSSILAFYPGECDGLFFSDKTREENLKLGVTEVSVDEMLYFIKNFEPYEVKLNDQYTAIVRSTHVEVGCQKISFDAVEKLYKLIQKRTS